MNATLLFLGGLGMQEILLIGFFILIFFGAGKIPEFMKGLGKGVREFKEGIREMNSEPTPPARTTSKPTTTSDPTTPEEEDGKKD